MNSSIPRPEYPRPHFVRNEWMCLNGEWEFEIDVGNSGFDRGLLHTAFSKAITVPFAPESVLSGIGITDFLNAVWYRLRVKVPEAWAGKNILLHFQAVDYDATVWINGKEYVRHRGGFTPFCCEIPATAATGELEIVVRAQDDHKQNTPKGKQTVTYANSGCCYTRTTGIWQTVWMEPVAGSHLQRPKITPDVAGRRFLAEIPVKHPQAGENLSVALSYNGKMITSASAPVGTGMTPTVVLPIPQEDLHLWQPGAAVLYDLSYTLIDAGGKIIDSATGYAGMREIAVIGKQFLINGQKVFQRQVLDQGYYADGIMTAPTDQALIDDIQLSLDAGFNSARLHQKVFEERFLYHADRMGYLVWGEFGDWGGFWGKRPVLTSMIAQWMEAVVRDYSHPSIIGWCPLNETHDIQKDTASEHDCQMLAMVLATKAADPTRPVLDTSGYSHRVPFADIYDSHDYEQDPAVFAQHHEKLSQDDPYLTPDRNFNSIPYNGQPYFVSEFGGIWWNPKAAADEPSWGYGGRPQSEEEFYERFTGLCNVLLDNPDMFGYCYTQLTDVFQEQNGIYHFDRSTKFDMNRIRQIQTRTAAYEK